MVSIPCPYCGKPIYPPDNLKFGDEVACTSRVARNQWCGKTFVPFRDEVARFVMATQMERHGGIDQGLDWWSCVCGVPLSFGISDLREHQVDQMTKALITAGVMPDPERN